MQFSEQFTSYLANEFFRFNSRDGLVQHNREVLDYCREGGNIPGAGQFGHQAEQEVHIQVSRQDGGFERVAPIITLAHSRMDLSDDPQLFSAGANGGAFSGMKTKVVRQLEIHVRDVKAFKQIFDDPLQVEEIHRSGIGFLPALQAALTCQEDTQALQFIRQAAGIL